MNKGESYTENELGKKIQETEAEIISIFNKEYLPYFLVKKANKLIAKWKVLTNWKEDAHNETCKYCGQTNGVHKMSCETHKIRINL